MGEKVATLKEPKYDVPVWHKITMNMDETDIVNNGWHIYLKDICTYATLSKVS